MTQAARYVTTKEVCDALAVSPSAVSRMVARGELEPAMRVGNGPGGGAFLFEPDVVEQLAKRRTRDHRSPAER